MNNRFACGKTLLLLAIASVGVGQELAGAAIVPYVVPVVRYFCHKDGVPADCNEPRLNELLWGGGYGELSAYIDAAMQSGDGAVQTTVAQWMKKQSLIENPVLMYKIARNAVSDANILATAGKGMRSGGPEDVRPTLVLLMKFCLYYYIDSIVCLRAMAKVRSNKSLARGRIDSSVKELSEKSGEIFNRVFMKWNILMRAQGAREDYYADVVRAITREWGNATYQASAMIPRSDGHELLRERLHGAAWVFGVSRNVHLGTTAHRYVKSWLGDWVSTDEPGGIKFGTPDAVYQEYLSLVENDELLEWYNALRKEAVCALRGTETVKAFFEAFSVSARIVVEARALIEPQKKRAGSGARAGAGGGDEEAHSADWDSDDATSTDGSTLLLAPGMPPGATTPGGSVCAAPSRLSYAAIAGNSQDGVPESSLDEETQAIVVSSGGDAASVASNLSGGSISAVDGISHNDVDRVAASGGSCAATLPSLPESTRDLMPATSVYRASSTSALSSGDAGAVEFGTPCADDADGSLLSALVIAAADERVTAPKTQAAAAPSEGKGKRQRGRRTKP
jgi:hypothetical protein